MSTPPNSNSLAKTGAPQPTHSLAPGLYRPRVVYCIARRERRIFMEQALLAAGAQPLFAGDLAESVQIITRELPHVILADAEFRDGSACDLMDQILRHPHLKKLPVVAFCMKRTKEEIAKLSSKPFAAITPQEQKPDALRKLIANALTRAQGPGEAVSPFYAPVSPEHHPAGIMAAMSSHILGLRDRWIVVLSDALIESPDSLQLHNKKYPDAAIEVSGGISLRLNRGHLHLFPRHRAAGLGLSWLKAIAALPAPLASSARGLGRIIVETTPGEGEALKQLLEKHGQAWKTLDAEELNKPTTPELLQATSIFVVLHPTAALSKMRWRSDLTSIPEDKKPNFIIAMSGAPPSPQGKIRFMRKPFSLATFLDTIEGVLLKTTDVLAQGKVPDASSLVPVSFECSGQWIGVDECGVVLAFPRMLQKGTRLEIHDSFLQTLHPGETFVVTSAAASTKPGIWHVKVEPAQSAGQSKLKALERIQKALSVNGNPGTSGGRDAS